MGCSDSERRSGHRNPIGRTCLYCREHRRLLRLRPALRGWTAAQSRYEPWDSYRRNRLPFSRDLGLWKWDDELFRKYWNCWNYQSDLVIFNLIFNMIFL